MKKILSLTLSAIALIGCLATSAAAYDLSIKMTQFPIGEESGFVGRQDNTQVAVDKVMVNFPDAQPFKDQNGRTLIPVRFVTEAMKADVVWNAEDRTAVITKDGITVEITIGEKQLRVTNADGTKSTVTMDTTAIIEDDRTYVPIRFVAEALGA